ncbi:helix-turn-helix domain-containing protein, partial [Streptococcus pyogenes]
FRMSKRSPKSLEEKLEVVLRYQKGERTAGQLAREYGISDDTVIDWMMKYQTNGIEGLKESHTWKKYSSDLKKSAVEDYLDGKGSTNT